MNLIPHVPSHPHKLTIRQFEHQHRISLNHIYNSIIEYLQREPNAQSIWSNIHYETFVEYMYENSFKSKSKLI